MKLINRDRINLLRRLLSDNVALIDLSVDLLQRLLLLLSNLLGRRLLVKLWLKLVSDQLLRLCLMLDELDWSLRLNFGFKLRHHGLARKQGHLLRQSRLLLADVSQADLLREAHLLFNLKQVAGLLLLMLAWHADQLLEVSGLSRDEDRNVAGRDLIHLELATSSWQLIHDWSVIVSRALEINVDNIFITRLVGHVSSKFERFKVK